MYSPYINQFSQPDSIVPNLYNPQSLNRYAYALNNPVRYMDPSGHVACRTREECDDMGMNPGGSPLKPKPDDEDNFDGNLGLGGGYSCSLHPEACGLEIPGDPVISDGPINPFIDIWNFYVDGVDVMSDSGCMDGLSGFLNNVTCVDYASIFFQDIATLFSSAGASVTMITTILGCVPGNGLGCSVGYAIGAGLHLTVFNLYESAFSTVSFLATGYSDVLTYDTYYNSWNDWGFGEDTKTGFFTWLAGTLLVEPFFDAGVDIYSSGYNHGYFCGISTILDCIP